MRKTIIVLSLLSAFMIAAAAYLCLEKKYIFPGPGTPWYWYTDAKNDGNSDFELLNGNETISFEFKLNGKFPYPFVGICFTPEIPMNLNGYEYLNIDVSAEGTDTLRFFIKTVIPGFSTPEDHLTYPHYAADIPVWENKGTYRFPMDDIQIVFWWYDAAGWDADTYPVERSFKETALFDLQSGENFVMDDPATVELRQIYFSRDPLSVLQPAFFALLLLWTAAGSGFLIGKYRGRRIPVIALDQIRSNPDRDEHTSVIIRTIAESYGDKSFSMSELCRITGFGSSTVTRKLKSYCGLTLSGYITMIRLEEAKRLLEATNLTVEAIASGVGFKSRTHFIGLFTKNEKLTPTQYRKNHAIH